MQDPPKGLSAEWLSKARDIAQSLHEHEEEQIKKLEMLSRHLNKEMSWVESLIWKLEKEKA